MNDSDVYKVRPAGRHINTIGRDLIQDGYAAIIELVKNAWDADSPDVTISFEEKKGEKGYVVVVEDHGHGMTRDVVIHQWMVPSTNDKKKRKSSPGKRIMQGRKGIGRYAASILGYDLLLETTTTEGEYTTLLLQWSDFEEAEFLDNVDVLIETKKSDFPRGTRLTIRNNGNFQDEWDEKQIKKLRFELKKLKSPTVTLIEEETGQETGDFKIFLNINRIKDKAELFEDEDITREEIKPFPIIDLYDYRISGHISEPGKGELTYYLQKSTRNSSQEIIPLDFGEKTSCGGLFFDIRVYDREKESIGSLIHKGLKDEKGNYLGEKEARRLLNDSNGIGVYRNGFRIRPLGDPDNDWLELNKNRIQNPSLKVGSNQVIGYVQIQSEEESDLIENSARDGLKKNHAYMRLQDISNKVIGELETKRFGYRKSEGLSRPALKIEREFETLFSSEELKKEIHSSLEKGRVNKETSDEVIAIIEKDTEKRNEILEDIRKSVAVYQGQATLGKIINVVLHEGRKPLNFFRNQIPNLNHWVKKLKENYSEETLQKVLGFIDGIGDNADIFVKLFSRLDPLASGRKNAKKPMFLIKEIKKAVAVFENELKRNNIQIVFEGDDEFQYELYEQDVYVVFTNLLDNSLYWISNSSSPERKILIRLESENNELQHIDYLDTGPGIAKELIDKELIFEPQFTTKPGGTGLGLPIAGEAAMRLGWEIEVFESDSGASFRIREKGDNENGED